MRGVGCRCRQPDACASPCDRLHPKRAARLPCPACGPAGLPELVPRFPELRYSPAQVAAETAALGLWGGILLAGGYWCGKAVAALAAAPGGVPLLAGLGVWGAASLAAAALLPPPVGRGKRGSSGTKGGGSSSSMEPSKQE